MKMIESFIKGKIDSNLCEDTYLISEDFVAVIDGVTSKTDFQHENKTTGKLASEIIHKVISNVRREAHLQEIISQTNKALRKQKKN